MAETGEPLTERELEVLEHIANGASNRQTALDLSISPNTVKVHIRNIYAKLGVSTRTEAMAVALQQGLLSMPGLEPVPEVEADSLDATAEAESEPLLSVNAEAIPAVPSPEQEETPTRPLAPMDQPVALHTPAVPAMPIPTGETRPTPTQAGRKRNLLLGGVMLAAILMLSAALLLSGRPFGNSSEANGTEPTVEAEPAFTETPIAGSNWAISMQMPRPQTNMASAAVGLDLYLVGGETAEGVVNSLDIYAIDEHRWQSGAPKLTAVSDASAVVVNGEVYVVGGRTAAGQPTTVVEAYSPLNDGWRPVTPLPRSASGGLALASGDVIYYFGGVDGSVFLADAYRYDPAVQRWESLPPMPEARAHMAGGVLHGDLYVVGGEGEEGALATCAVFSPADDAWSSCAELLSPRIGAGAAVLLNKLYIFGGQQAGEEEGFSEFFDVEEGSWSPIDSPMLDDTPQWAHMGVANVETRIYVAGGRQGDELLDKTYVYTPMVYQFFIPTASGGGESEE